MIELRPITRDLANQAVRDWHKHHKPVRQSILRVGAFIDSVFVGAVIVETPKTPALAASPVCFEVTRLATCGASRLQNGHVDAVASRLLGAAWQWRYHITLTEVRLQELHDITEDDAIAEGVLHEGDTGASALALFQEGFEAINGPGTWRSPSRCRRSRHDDG